MSEFKPIISIGFDRGEADFRVNMSIADLSRHQMDELCRMIPWTIKEALILWLDHSPHLKEMRRQGVAIPMGKSDG